MLRLLVCLALLPGLVGLGLAPAWGQLPATNQRDSLQARLQTQPAGGKGPATVHLVGETAAHEKIDLTINATEVATP